MFRSKCLFGVLLAVDSGGLMARSGGDNGRAGKGKCCGVAA